MVVFWTLWDLKGGNRGKGSSGPEGRLERGSELGMREISPILTLNPTPSPSRKFYAENLLFKGASREVWPERSHLRKGLKLARVKWVAPGEN